VREWRRRPGSPRRWATRAGRARGTARPPSGSGTARSAPSARCTPGAARSRSGEGARCAPRAPRTCRRGLNWTCGWAPPRSGGPPLSPNAPPTRRSGGAGTGLRGRGAAGSRIHQSRPRVSCAAARHPQDRGGHRLPVAWTRRSSRRDVVTGASAPARRWTRSRCTGTTAASVPRRRPGFDPDDPGSAWARGRAAWSS